MSPLRNRTKVWVVTGAAIGTVLTAAGVAAAATGSTAAAGGSTAATASTAAPSAGTPVGTAPDPATLAHGPGETLLTGTTAAKVKAAAEAAVPGATVIRVETDSGGAKYEAHMRKADGSYVTVKVDASFAVTSTVQGFGGPGGGGSGGGGQPPTGSQPPAGGSA